MTESTKALFPRSNEDPAMGRIFIAAGRIYVFQASLSLRPFLS
jgi:hypothetical protein